MNFFIIIIIFFISRYKNINSFIVSTLNNDAFKMLVHLNSIYGDRLIGTEDCIPIFCINKLLLKTRKSLLRYKYSITSPQV